VPIIFAINKIDKLKEKIKEKLAGMNLLVDGVVNPTHDISAKVGTGVKELLEKLLEAEVLDLKSN
jgi:translation initiation factor IF-2